MLKHRQIFFHVKRKARIDVYITGNELEDLIDNLSSTELKLYSKLHNSILHNPTIEYFTDENLSKELNLSIGSIKNAKTGLKQKGYALIVKFKDELGKPCLRVIVGKDQVTLYNLGINVQITNAKAFNKLLDRFPVLDPNITQQQREDYVKQFNEYYLENLNEFK